MGAGGPPPDLPVGAVAAEWSQSHSTRSLSVRVLGPLTVTVGDRTVGLGGTKERLVLVHLLARANAVVSVDALIEGVWAGRPPRSAARTLQSYVARLRRELEPRRGRGVVHEVLVGAGGGYRLQVAADELDALRFEELARLGAEQLRRGDDRADTTLRDALGLWRGDAYGEFGDVEACAAEARRLTELRLVALEDRFDADLAAGQTGELVAELETMVFEHPFRERLWGELMLALYRSGRQRDALAAYQRARSVLVNELGVEPGPELRRLEAAALAHDPSLAGSGVEPAMRLGLPVALESLGSAFVGRDADLEWLQAQWAEAANGRGRFVSLLGPEGIGKTRLVAELARRVVESGVVLYGRCDHAHRGARALLDQALRGAGASIDRLDDGGSVDDLAAAVARFLPAWSQGRPVLVVLDDLHLADAEALEVVADLAGWCAANPMLVVGAFRTDIAAVTGRSPEPGEVSAQLVLGGLAADAVGHICALYAHGDWSAGDVARLHQLTDGVPLRVHEQASEWARQRAGRRAEDAADRLTGARVRLAASRAEIADSVEAIGRMLEQRRAQLSGRDATQASTGCEPCPYKGLARFEESDAPDFFGRERLVAEIVARLPGAALLTVFGPSGSGKSSLVRAGVLPAVAAGVLPGTEGWRTVTLRPGADPAQELDRRLRPPHAGRPSDRRLVFVDQFEEMFTLCADEAERDRFVGRLTELVDHAGTVVVIAIRADHFGRCAAYPALAERLTSDDVLVGPMRDTELRRVVELPAQRAGLDVEPGLVEVIVADVAGRAGALPLLSTALAETWERRENRTLTLAGYRAAGGVNGALARMAEDAYQALPAGPRAAARRVLLRLCDAGDDGALDLRRRLPTAEAAPGNDADARTALSILVDRRLLTVDRDAVEVAHEALLREWPRLRTWLDEDVQGRRLHRRLRDAARSWDANDHDPFELYRGTRLDGAVDWAAGHDADLNDRERAFLDASRTESEREAEAARRRIADKARTNRRLLGLLAGVAILLVLALIAGLLFLQQRNEADETARVDRARQLASASVLALQEDPERSILLALEAVDITRTVGDGVLPEALGALQQAVQTSRVIFRSDEGAYVVDASRNGAFVASGSPPESMGVIVWDAVTGEQLRTLTDMDQVGDLGFSPDGRLLAVSYSTPEPDGQRPVVIVWDPATGGQVYRLFGPVGEYTSPTFSPDGLLVAAVNVEGRVMVWDLASASQRSSFAPGSVIRSIEFLPDGQSLIAAQPAAERVGFYSVDGEETGALPTPGFAPEFLALDPAGSRLALGSQASSAAQVWNLETQQLISSIPGGDVGPVDWSPDSERLAVAGSNQAVVRIVDPATGDDLITLAGHKAGSFDAAFIGDGDGLASVEASGGLRIWDVTPDGPPDLGALGVYPGDVWHMTFSPDGGELTVSTEGTGLEVLDTATGERLASLTDQLVGFQGNGRSDAASADGRLVASVSAIDGRAAVRELPSLDVVTSLPPCADPVAFSAEGARLVVAGSDNCPSRVVEIPSGREILDLGQRFVPYAAFNPAGRFAADRYLAVNIRFESLEIYDMTTGDLVASHDFPGMFFGPSYDPLGRWLTGSTSDGKVWVLDVAAFVGGAVWNDALILNQVAHTTSVPDPTISADGILATRGFGDGLVRLWDVETGAMIVELRVDPTQGFAVEFSPDGDYLYSADTGNVLRRYPVDTDELIELAESRLTRHLSPDECRQYLGSTECP